MRWFILLICLMIGSTESRNILKRQVEPSHRHVADIYNVLGENDFDTIVLAMLSQNLQKGPLEALDELVVKMHDFAKNCVQHPKDEECVKPLPTLFYGAVCSVPDLNTHYDWSDECCAKEGAARSQCFREHSNVVHEPFKKPTPEAEELCPEVKNDTKHILHNYIYEASRGHPNLYSAAMLGLAKQYERIVSECCDAEENETCFLVGMAEHKKVTHIIEDQQTHICHILNNFPVRTLQAVKLAQISQKYPRASLNAVQKLVEEVTHLDEDCCHGDMLACMVERMELTQHTCDHHAELSSKLETCCQKPIAERTTCIINQENDDLPEGLPPHVTEFIEDPKVCKHFEKEKGYLARFLYEYARRHPELSVELLVAIAHGYEKLLVKCCKEANPPKCYKDVATLADVIKRNTVLLLQNCEAQEKHGDYFFQIELLGRYTKKMPQVTAKTLLELTGKMVEVVKKCCALDDKKKMPCADEGLSILIGQMCERQKQTFINDNVRHCCNDSYSGRRACFTGLGVDPSYVPPEITDDTFHFDAALCTTSLEEVPIKKMELFIQLLKLKPNLEPEEIKAIIAEFTKMLTKCCAEADHQECFNTEKPILIEHCKQLIEH